VERRDLLQWRFGDDRGASDDRPAEGIVAEDGPAQDVEDLVLRVVQKKGNLRAET
jgi:hypothetical protein